MGLDSSSMGMQGISGVGDKIPDDAESLTEEQKALAYIVTQQDATQIIETNYDKDTAIGSLENLKTKKPELNESINKVIANLQEKTQAGIVDKQSDITKDKFAGGIPRQQKVDPAQHIDKTDKFNVKGSTGSTLV